MPRGRKPLPTKLKAARGNPGKRPLNADEPQYAAGAGGPPELLDEVGRAEWERVSAMLTASGVLTQADRGVLTMYCDAWSRWVQASEKVKETGEVLEGRTGAYYQNPYLGIANRAADRVAKCAALLGLDPSSRSRLAVPPKAVSVSGKPKVRPKTHLDRLGAPG